MPRVMIIEDEVLLRTAITRALAKLPHMDVVNAGNLDEALILVDDCVPDLIISDIELPGRLGLEVLGELAQRGLHIPILFVSGFVPNYAQRIPLHPQVHVREKPLDLEDLKKLVLELLGNFDSKAVEVPFSVIDYVQLSCQGRYSMEIRPELGGSPVGTIIIHLGMVWAASDHQGSGEEAFYRLVYAEHDRIHLQTLREVTAERNIKSEWVALVLEAARRMDEASRTDRLETASTLEKELDQGFEALFSLSNNGGNELSVQPLLSQEVSSPVEAPGHLVEETRTAVAVAETEPEPDLPELTFDEVWEQVVDALLERDYPAASRWLELAAKLEPEHPLVRVNQEKVRQLLDSDNSGFHNS